MPFLLEQRIFSAAPNIGFEMQGEIRYEDLFGDHHTRFHYRMESRRFTRMPNASGECGVDSWLGWTQTGAPEDNHAA
jgi:hypothetical protein